MKEQLLYLEDIRDSIEAIEKYTAYPSDDPIARQMMQDAIIRHFTVIGEATKLLDQQIKGHAPEIDWRGIAGFRDILVHRYRNIDVQRIRQGIETGLPELKAAVERLIEELDRPDHG